MANLIRGEVPFRAAGRELFLQYGTREIAEVQAALGFRRPDPFQADVVEEVDVAVEEGGKPKVDELGEVFRRRRLLVDASERQRRMVAAFEACWMDPDPEAAVVFLRYGLRPWERQSGAKLTEEAFHEIVRAIGLARMKTLHFQAIAFGIYLKGEEDGGESRGKGESVASASTT